MLDRYANGGWTLLYISDDISSRLPTDYKTSDNTECLFTEVGISKKIWLLCCTYNPKKKNISKHLCCLCKGLDIKKNTDLSEFTENPFVSTWQAKVYTR